MSWRSSLIDSLIDREAVHERQVLRRVGVLYGIGIRSFNEGWDIRKEII